MSREINRIPIPKLLGGSMCRFGSLRPQEGWAADVFKFPFPFIIAACENKSQRITAMRFQVHQSSIEFYCNPQACDCRVLCPAFYFIISRLFFKLESI